MITTWQDRYNSGELSFEASMQAEILELRAALKNRQDGDAISIRCYQAQVDDLTAELNEEKMRGYQADQAIANMAAENERLREVMKKLLVNADWRVGGVLTPTSKRSDFQSSGYSIVKTRDLASVRDALGEKS